jgi:hypothetical protein
MYKYMNNNRAKGDISRDQAEGEKREILEKSGWAKLKNRKDVTDALFLLVFFR